MSQLWNNYIVNHAHIMHARTHTHTHTHMHTHAHTHTHTLVTYSLCLFLRIPDSISKDIEKRCQSIYPLHDVFIRKVKVLKKPKFDSEYKAIV